MSLLAQSRIPDEILVINNASTDATRGGCGGDPARRAPLTWLERVERRFQRDPVEDAGPQREELPAVKQAPRANVDVALTLFRNGLLGGGLTGRRHLLNRASRRAA